MATQQNREQQRNQQSLSSERDDDDRVIQSKSMSSTDFGVDSSKNDNDNTFQIAKTLAQIKRIVHENKDDGDDQ